MLLFSYKNFLDMMITLLKDTTSNWFFSKKCHKQNGQIANVPVVFIDFCSSIFKQLWATDWRHRAFWHFENILRAEAVIKD